MQLKFAVLVPHSEYKNFLEDLFQTKLTPQEAGLFIFDREIKIQDGVTLKDPRRTLKESVEAPQTITFFLEVALGLPIAIVGTIVGEYIFSRLKKVSWLKIGDTQPQINIEDIRKAIREELEKIKDKNNDSQR